MAADPDAIVLELLAPGDARVDPYPAYRRLRSAAPVHRTAFGPVVVSSHAACQRVLRDPRLGKDQDGRFLTDQQGNDVQAAARRRARRSILYLNPPGYDRQRAAIRPAFRDPERLRAIVEDVTDAVLARHRPGDQVDVLADIAEPIAVATIGAALGFDLPDPESLVPALRRISMVLEPTLDDATAAEVVAADLALSRVFDAVLAGDEAPPELVHALRSLPPVPGRGAGTDEATTLVLTVFGAGFETTANLIANGLRGLLAHRDQWQLLVEGAVDPAQAVDELLRWDTPVQLSSRIALEPTELDGVPVDAGQLVICLLGSANRDPERFDDPDDLRLARVDGPPLSFGSGARHCVGAALARVEAEVVVGALARSFPGLRGTGAPLRWKDRLTIRGLTALPVRLDPAGGGAP